MSWMSQMSQTSQEGWMSRMSQMSQMNKNEYKWHFLNRIWSSVFPGLVWYYKFNLTIDVWLMICDVDPYCAKLGF